MPWCISIYVKRKDPRVVKTEKRHRKVSVSERVKLGQTNKQLSTLLLFFFYLNIFAEAFAQEHKCSSRKLTLSQYLYLSKSTNVVQVQCMGSDVR